MFELKVAMKAANTPVMMQKMITKTDLMVTVMHKITEQRLRG